jgi:hypothetical protein
VTNMNSHPLQFGAREETASSRQLTQRLVVDADAHAVWNDEGDTRLSLSRRSLLMAYRSFLNAAQVAAAGEGYHANDPARSVHLLCEYHASRPRGDEVRRCIQFEYGGNYNGHKKAGARTSAGGVGLK